MIVLGIAAASVAAFVASSAYYAVVTPLERRALGDKAIDRGRPGAGKVTAELLRTAVVASAFAWIAAQSHRTALPAGLLLAVVLWVGLPVVLLSGSVLWERVAPVTAAMHAGDWLLKLLLIAVLVGVWH